mmetsp:Transcript_19554/g.21746  ORF Transcript_19554/g.21746 Transcript_19554/m.21746 type:complete len:187 (+) Transcript_19554:81-641(+)
MKRKRQTTKKRATTPTGKKRLVKKRKVNRQALDVWQSEIEKQALMLNEIRNSSFCLDSFLERHWLHCEACQRDAKKHVNANYPVLVVPKSKTVVKRTPKYPLLVYLLELLNQATYAKWVDWSEFEVCDIKEFVGFLRRHWRSNTDFKDVNIVLLQFDIEYSGIYNGRTRFKTPSAFNSSTTFTDLM